MSILYRTLYKYIILRVVNFPQLTMCCINLHLQHEPQLRVSHNGRRRPTCLVCTLPFPLVSIITSAVPGRYDKEKRLSWTGSEQCADAKHSATSLLKTNILTPNDRKRAHIKVSKYVKAYCGWQQNDRHATHNGARITDMPPTMVPESQTCHPQWCPTVFIAIQKDHLSCCPNVCNERSLLHRTDGRLIECKTLLSNWRLYSWQVDRSNWCRQWPSTNTAFLSSLKRQQYRSLGVKLNTK